jgi:TIR domain
MVMSLAIGPAKFQRTEITELVEVTFRASKGTLDEEYRHDLRESRSQALRTNNAAALLPAEAASYIRHIKALTIARAQAIAEACTMYGEPSGEDGIKNLTNYYEMLLSARRSAFQGQAKLKAARTGISLNQLPGLLRRFGSDSQAALLEGKSILAKQSAAFRGQEEMPSELEEGSASKGKSNTRLVFLSHAAVDQEIAIFLKGLIEKAIGGSEVFVSSDTEDVRPGDEWVTRIRENLRAAKILLLLASERGLKRPWVWYETGSAWSREIRTIPCCLGKIRKNQLAAPFASYQAVNIDEAGYLRNLLFEVGRGLNLSVEIPDLEPIATELRGLDKKGQESELAKTTPQRNPQIEQVVLNGDDRRFNVQMANLRDLLVERWYPLNAFGPLREAGFEEKAQRHLHNVFYPALSELVHAGLLLIKYKLNVDRFERVSNLLVEVFNTCGALVSFPPPTVSPLEMSLTRGTVGLEVLAGARVLASYAMRMKSYEYVPLLLKAYVTQIGPSLHPRTGPFLFWPLRMNVPGNDRIAYIWSEVAKPRWLGFFGNEQSFLDAACQLEFILSLNSYLATKNKDAFQWLREFRSDTSFDYWYSSDLWRYKLEPIVPIATQMYEALTLGPDAPFLLDLSVEHAVFQKAFSPSSSTTVEQRHETFLQYLKELMKWQAQAAQSQAHFPLAEPDWGPVLGPQMKNG